MTLSAREVKPRSPPAVDGVGEAAEAVGKAAGGAELAVFLPWTRRVNSLRKAPPVDVVLSLS